MNVNYVVIHKRLKMVKWIVTYTVEKRKIVFATNRDEAKYKFNKTMQGEDGDILYIEEE